MRDILWLGPCPSNEEPIVGSPNMMHQECIRYRQLLETLNPGYRENECRFRVRHEYNGGWDYREVVIEYETDNPDSVTFAYKVDAEGVPATWENDAQLAAFVQTGNFDHLKGYKYPKDDPYL